MIIAIDGPSGSGKSTIGKTLANGLRALFISSGSLYRAICYYTLKEGLDLRAIESLTIDDLDRMRVDVEENHCIIKIDDECIMDKLGNQEIANQASKIAKLPNIRQIISSVIQKIGIRNDCVIEGRDIGTHVYPDAFLKIYLTANIDIRAKRRFTEYKSEKKDDIEFENLINEMKLRDKQDKERKNSPLKRAIDAIEIDTSNLSVKEVVGCILKHYKLMIKKSTKTITKTLSRSSASFIYRFFQGFCHKWFRLMYRLDVHGIENFLHCNEGTILAPNHTSFFDPAIIGSSSPGEIFFLAQDYLFKIPILGQLIKKLNSFPIKGSNQGDFFVLKQIIGLLKKGKKVVVFPEGSRSADGLLQDFKSGVALLSVQSGATILPIYIEGAYKVFPRGRFFFKPFGHFRLFFGSEICSTKFISGGKKEIRQLIMRQLYKEIVLLKNKCDFIYC